MEFERLYKSIQIDDEQYKYYDMNALNDSRYDELPICIRYLLEAAIRNCDGFLICKSDVEAILDWKNSVLKGVEIPFIPSRVLLQDFTGVPAIVDLASIRDAVQKLGFSPDLVNPVCQADLVIDHSVQVDHYGNSDALAKNQALEFQRNEERFKFLKWGAHAFKNLSIIPPGSGIVHQVNLEYIAKIVAVSNHQCLYPDSVVGTDSHTTMNNGSGVLAWGVGGIEAEAVMLGQPIHMLLPEVIGYRLYGTLPTHCTSTDLVLTITNKLRSYGVVGKFIEFFGSGVANLSIADRATVANMCPEYGATVAFFPVDDYTLRYLRCTGREEHAVKRAETYLKQNKMFFSTKLHAHYTKVLELDLSSIVPCISGPKRPQDTVAITELFSDFKKCLTQKVSFKGFGIKPEQISKTVQVDISGQKAFVRHGSVVISAITSCTNTSNPSVMLAAGLLAKKAVEAGLQMPIHVKTSLSPGSGVVTKYLECSGLLPYLQQLGYHVTGYGCMTCIGNSGALHPEITKAIELNDLVVASVLSGNRNFEGRIHSHVRANYLASPPLVIVYGLAGRIDFDIEHDPIGKGNNGKDIYFKDIWPARADVAKLEEAFVLPQFFKEVYANIKQGNEQWQKLASPFTTLYPWDDHSTYIKKAPFFENMTLKIPAEEKIRNAYVLLYLGDSVTTDHISPAGCISRTSPAARYLISRNISVNDFNTYGARRGNDEVMTRGTFANIRLVNKLASTTGPKTLHIPSGSELDIFDAAEYYQREGHQIIVLAGKEYGSGSSRDWAAKGPHLLGVKAIIAESYERIHRSNLVGMGIIPLQFLDGQNAETLGLSGKEQFTVEIPENLEPGMIATIKVSDGKIFKTQCCFDTDVEIAYYKNGGILPYVIRKLVEKRDM
ncbi:unnamed protein product [Thelazia callipaeda]|uniref:Cytoplasmic aconitate hydratase n=1 Tax=Thelazia callipaeda TaxID=103827 RepID=A0A0N5DAC6_THECL|nr:unnamed protein product [Thelazia callipaeda]